jgi:hypothetical protein
LLPTVCPKLGPHTQNPKSACLDTKGYLVALDVERASNIEKEFKKNPQTKIKN